MVFALGAGKLFDIHKAAEFEETILGKIQPYTTLSFSPAAPGTLRQKLVFLPF